MVFAVVSALVLGACGGGDSDKSDDKGMLEQMGEAAKQMGKAAEGMKDIANDFDEMEQMEPVPPIHYKDLMAFLPDDAFGLTEEEPEGETGKLGEWQYSQASAEFHGDNGESVQVNIFDYAFIGAMYAPYRMMFAMGFSKESTKGYERSTEIMGFPGYEKWEKKSKREQVTVLVGKRFIVTVETHNIEEGQARELVESMNLLELADTGSAPS
jgi:hypothetical protein